MISGFVRVAAATPTIRVADCDYNAKQIISLIKKAAQENIHFICLPELCITSYTCGDLFLQDTLLESAKIALQRIVCDCADFNVLAVVGLPISHKGKLFNVAAVFCGGKILGFVPKTHIPNYGEFYELRYFSPAMPDTDSINLGGNNIPFGTKIIFQCENLSEFSVAIEICEDLWMPHPPGSHHATAGATVIANLSASTETIGKAAYRRSLVAGQSARLLCGYVYADAGHGESSSDMVFSGHNMICENGVILAESRPFGDGWAVSEIDLSAISHDRRKVNTFGIEDSGYIRVPFSADVYCDTLLRVIDPAPFIPKDKNEKAARCEEILDIQAAGLAKRLEHTGCKAVLGVSGGLDSTLALIVTARACDLLKIPRDILAVTMPCFGTTERTKNNAIALCNALKIPCREIDISESVRQHLREIGHSEESHDVVYENAQARVRTLVLMDLANKVGGIVVGSGDLSELALGWATYNGDHMSMYGVNAGVPKTLVRHIISHVADTTDKLNTVLSDILDTPISPELLPHNNGEISQRTEDIIGNYELHDFFIYHFLRWGRKPETIFNLACKAFGKYTPDEIRNCLSIFYNRFFSQQFKRNCLPDGAKIGSVTLSPRGDWRMPSDAVSDSWMSFAETYPWKI